VTTCGQCDASVKTKRENYRYTASGLPTVTLLGVEVRRCPRCGETEVVIPAIAELHRAIAGAVIRKRARLTPPEIRFLRTVLGWSGTDFAKHMGTTPETVSRWEHGQPIGTAADRLLRLLVATKAPIEPYPVDILAELAVDNRPATPVPLGLQRDQRTGWHVRPGAALVPA
jgi:putative zinc finger/helix-turn-helix YgiT family protein